MEETSGNKKWVVIIAIAILLGVGAAAFMFLRGSSSTTTTSTTTPTAFVEEPTATPEPSVNKADITIKILNGSGVVGEAGRVQKMLEDADFVVESTDNADNYDYETTEIQAKSSVSSTITEEISELLSDEYTVDTSQLGEDEETDIVIIVGVRKNAPTAKPTTASTATTGTVTPTTKPTGSTTPTPSVSPTVIP